MRLRTGRDSWDCARKLTRDLKQGPETENTSPGIFRSMHPFNRSQEMLSAYVVPPRVSFICLFCCAVAWRFSVREGRGVWATSLGAPGVCWRPRQCPLLIMMMVPALTLVLVARYYPTPLHRPVCFTRSGSLALGQGPKMPDENVHRCQLIVWEPQTMCDQVLERACALLSCQRRRQRQCSSSRTEAPSLADQS